MGDRPTLKLVFSSCQIGEYKVKKLTENFPEKLKNRVKIETVLLNPLSDEDAMRLDDPIPETERNELKQHIKTKAIGDLEQYLGTDGAVIFVSRTVLKWLIEKNHTEPNVFSEGADDEFTSERVAEIVEQVIG
jgi:hypothetical protein